MRFATRRGPSFVPSGRALPWLLVLLMVCAGCGPRSGVSPEDEANVSSPHPSPGTPTHDAFPDKAEIRHATGFTVSYHGTYKVVRVAADVKALQLSSGEGRAWEKASFDLLVLVQRGTDPPVATGHLAEATFIEVPIHSAAVNRDADALRIKHLGFMDRLVGIGGTGIFDSELRDRVESGTLPAIGSALHRTMDLELLLTETPAAVFLRVASLDHTYEFQRLRDLGLASVPVYSWAETSALARAEWLKYIALFFNAEAEAHRQFEQIQARYDELVTLVGTRSERPKAVWAYSPRAGGWRAHCRGVEAGLLGDAGMINVMAVEDAAVSSGEVGHSEGLSFSDERFLKQAGDAEIWITWSPTDERWPSARYLEGFLAYRDDNVFHHRKRRLPSIGADDWYELGQLRPDLILADLIAVAHPELLPDHELVFLDRLPRTKVRDLHLSMDLGTKDILPSNTRWASTRKYRHSGDLHE
ncbi:MAG: ABC transporter substrate-binding protein [Thermoanaerobaculia bacterium]|nr:ABC transporter substrate-binding protein [Thermoanaerobaculia bacterium]